MGAPVRASRSTPEVVTSASVPTVSCADSGEADEVSVAEGEAAGLFVVDPSAETLGSGLAEYGVPEGEMDDALGEGGAAGSDGPAETVPAGVLETLGEGRESSQDRASPGKESTEASIAIRPAIIMLRLGRRFAPVRGVMESPESELRRIANPHVASRC